MRWEPNSGGVHEPGRAANFPPASSRGPRVRRAEGTRGNSFARNLGAIVCLPVAILSVLIGPLTERAHAAQISPLRAEIERAATTGYVQLLLHNGQLVGGVFHGF